MNEWQSQIKHLGQKGFSISFGGAISSHDHYRVVVDLRQAWEENINIGK